MTLATAKRPPSPDRSARPCDTKKTIFFSDDLLRRWERIVLGARA